MTIRKKLKFFIFYFLILLVAGIIYLFNYTGGFWVSKGLLSETLTDKITFTIFNIDKQAIYPNSMDLKMNGEVNGRGILSFGWSDSVFYKTDTISDIFQVNYNSDWYNDTCFVRYTPISATKGELIVDYRIYSSFKGIEW